jgi:hypothetical protein
MGQAKRNRDSGELRMVVDDVAATAIFMILANRPPADQGAIIALLTARWLAGHMVSGDRAATGKMREELLAAHVEAVRDLTEPQEAEILANLRKRSH